MANLIIQFDCTGAHCRFSCTSHYEVQLTRKISFHDEWKRFPFSCSLLFIYFYCNYCTFTHTYWIATLWRCKNKQMISSQEWYTMECNATLLYWKTPLRPSHERRASHNVTLCHNRWIDWSGRNMRYQFLFIKTLNNRRCDTLLLLPGNHVCEV